MQIRQPPHNELPEPSSAPDTASNQSMQPRLEVAEPDEPVVRHYVPPLLDYQIKGIPYSPLNG